jgi:hypothetical protein
LFLLYGMRDGGKIADICGETFIDGLLTMSAVHIDEKYRDNYVTAGAYTRPPVSST